MPKSKNPKLAIHLDLLRPQSNPEKFLIKLIRWLLSSGRYIFIFVEGLVLIAFIARFKIDADLASKKEEIEAKIPYIKSLKTYEILIRQTQLKLSTIDGVRVNSVDYSVILKKIADQTPQGVKITSLNMTKNVGRATIQISATAQTNNDLTSFFTGLKEDKTFSEVTLVSVGLEQGSINFAINANANPTNSGGQSL